MPDLPTTNQPANGLAPSELLLGKLASLRQRQARVTSAAGAARALALSLLVIGMEMALDYWLDLPWALRAVWLTAASMALLVIVIRHALGPWLRRADDDTLALLVEKHRSEFHSRLISAVQLARPRALPPGASAELARALVEETETLAQSADFRSIVSNKPLYRYARWAAVGLVAAGLTLAWGGQDTFDLLRRAFLSQVPVPRKTRVFVMKGDLKVGRGDPVVIQARAEGVVPRAGTLVIKSLVRRDQQFVMERATNQPSFFERAIENVQQDFNYAVRLGDGSSRTHHVEVIPRPTVVSMQCEQAPPAYTGLPVVRRHPGDLLLLAGSTLRFTAQASKTLRQANARLEGLDKTIPLVVATNQPRQIQGSISIPAGGLTGFSIEMVDTDGMESRDPATYHIETLLDKTPTVRLITPDRKEELVTQAATLRVGFLAEDDFRVAKIWLRYKVGELENASTNSVELELSGAEGPRVERIYPWKVSSLSPTPALGARVEFWIEVADNNDVTGPGRGASDHQLLRVVTPEEKRADLLTRAGDYLGTIGDVAGDQERVSENVRSIILEKRP
jgi:hypothetical protein